MLAPIDVDVSGTTDANGNLTLTQIANPSQFCNLKVIGQVGGTPVWVISVNGRAVTFGRGARVDLGPIFTQPRDQVGIQVIGAPAGTQLTAKLLGVRGEMAEVIVNFSPAPNTIAVDVTGQSNVVGTMQAASAQTVGPTNFPIPVGTQSIGFLAYLTAGLSTPNDITIKGHVTGHAYVSITGGDVGAGAASLSTQGPQWVSFDPTDTSVDVTMTAHVGLPGTIDILASPLLMAVDIRQIFQGNDIFVALDAGQPLPSALRRSYDWKQDQAISGAGTPQISQVAGGNTLVVAYIKATFLNTTAAAVAAQIQLLDGLTVIDHSWIVAPANGGDKLILTGLGYQLAGNAGLQWDRALAANEFATLDMAGYFA